MCTAVIAHGGAAPTLETTEHDLDGMGLFSQGVAVARLLCGSCVTECRVSHPLSIGIVATVGNRVDGGGQEASKHLAVPSLICPSEHSPNTSLYEHKQNLSGLGEVNQHVSPAGGEYDLVLTP